MKREPHEVDTPLFRRDDAVGELLRRGNAEFLANSGQAEAQRRLEARLARPAPRARLAMSLAAAAVVTLVFVYTVRSPVRAPEPAPQPQLATAPQRGEQEPVVTPPRVNDEIAGTLAQGPTRLPDGSAVELAAASKASWQRTARGIHVELSSGELRVAVPAQATGQAFEVRAGSYRFVVLGTELSVRSTMYESHLEVFSGRVEVHKEQRTVAVVKAGERWVGTHHTGGASAKHREPAAREAPEPLPEPAHVAPKAEDCTVLVKAQAFAPAAACYARQAEGSGLAAELALFELSRLRVSALSDAPGAVRALEEHQRRFPAGALSQQVQLAMVRTLSAAGRHADALRALEPLIARGGPKRAELEQLRGELEVRVGAQR
jgi:hypothetical protein